MESDDEWTYRKRRNWRHPVLRIPPLLKFSSITEFRDRHESATLEQFTSQARSVKEFNVSELRLKAWVITAPPEDQPWLGYIVRVDLNEGAETKRIPKPPGVGQSCKLRFFRDDGTSSSWFSCKRGAETISLNQSWSNCTELVVQISDPDVDDFEDLLIPLLDGGWAARSLWRQKSEWIKVQLQLDVLKATMETELGALNQLTNGRAGRVGKDAFSYMMDFRKPKKVMNLSASFPHLANLDKIPDVRLHEKVKNAIEGFNEDQRNAYACLNSLPERICFVPGGPGAGKTWWALTMAILSQAGTQRCQTLYLLDVNKPVDDAANKMKTMYWNFGTDKSVVRVIGWPMADSTSCSASGSDSDEEDADNIPQALKDADFTEGFLRELHPIFPRDLEKAPTLDQLALEYYSNQPENYSAIDQALDGMFAKGCNGQNWETDMEALRKSLIPLYYEVLSRADFIATTPVTATRLSRIIDPELVIFDECAHARELTSMIALAYFRPKAWFFVGDHRQTEPFVEESRAPYSSQLKVSTMERADANGAAPNQLLINHRAYGGLERLASKLFYKNAMRSNKSGDDLFPEGVVHRLEWLKALTVGKRVSGKFITPRLVVNYGGAGAPSQNGISWCNPVHQEFVMEQVDSLLRDPNFFQVGSTEPGTIMIVSPYKQAILNYQGAVNKLPTQQMKWRVQVRTVDTAQGQEADIVFLDMVRTAATEHTRNPKRLCVAITRARQAEVILMDSGMARSGHLRSIWESCESGEDGAILHIDEKYLQNGEKAFGHEEPEKVVTGVHPLIVSPDISFNQQPTAVPLQKISAVQESSETFVNVEPTRVVLDDQLPASSPATPVIRGCVPDNSPWPPAAVRSEERTAVVQPTSEANNSTRPQAISTGNGAKSPEESNGEVSRKEGFGEEPETKPFVWWW